MFRIILSALLGLAAAAAAPPDNLADLKRAFRTPPDDARIMMRWWWFGPSVTREGIERELRTMKAGGIGGVEVQPVYPLELDDPATGFRNVSYLSSEFLDLLRFTAETARSLGMRMDMTLGSGWPYGGPHIPITQAAGRLRWDKVKVTSRRVPVPDLAHGEQLIAAFSAPSGKEVTGIQNGVVWLEPGAPLPAELWFFIASRTGMMVKRPAIGAEGFVLDHYDRAAIENHLRAVADPMLRVLGALRPHAVFCDSLEVFGSDWTADLPEEFRKRRGYDLKPYLPALASGSGVEAQAVRHDWGRTLTELYEERFMVPLRDWSKSNRTLFRIQGYGMPPATIASNALADLPEGEGAQWKVVRASRWAASASHIYGRPVTSSETWTWLHSPSFRATPLDVKAEADLHFLQGINQLIGHGWPYTPPGAEYPGWRFYAAGVFDEKNPWWIVMPDLALYLQRVSSVLRQGRPSNDVALYLPNSDAWSHFAPGRVHMIDTLREHLGTVVMPQILEAGYGLDFFDDGSLAARGRVERGRLFLGDNVYRVVVLPAVETIPAATMRRLEEFARGGGIVIATRRLPATAPGLKASEEDKRYVKQTSSALFDAPGRFVRNEPELGAALRSLTTPDLLLAPPSSEIGFVHRTTDAGEIYFIANTSNARWSGRAAFRVPSSLEPQLWNPVTGEAAGLSVAERSREAVTVALNLAPYESAVVVFSKERAAQPLTETPRTLADLSEGWSVRFGENGPSVSMSSLRSWTESEQTRYFSGAATYEREFTLASQAGRVEIDFGEGMPLTVTTMRNGMRAWLDAPVRESAVVYVNGERAGSVWCPPYRLDVTKFLKAGANRLRIVVGNLALNAMAGRPLPSYRLLNLRYGVRFEAQDMDQVKPIPSGLVGKVRLVSRAEAK